MRTDGKLLNCSPDCCVWSGRHGTEGHQPENVYQWIRWCCGSPLTSPHSPSGTPRQSRRSHGVPQEHQQSPAFRARFVCCLLPSTPSRHSLQGTPGRNCHLCGSCLHEVSGSSRASLNVHPAFTSTLTFCHIDPGGDVIVPAMRVALNQICFPPTPPQRNEDWPVNWWCCNLDQLCRSMRLGLTFSGSLLKQSSSRVLPLGQSL